LNEWKESPRSSTFHTPACYSKTLRCGRRIGTRITLYVHLKPPCGFESVAPSELIGLVSRHTSDGFAVKFEDSRDPDLRQIVDDAAALVAVTK
jgi:hypothetical protein